MKQKKVLILIAIVLVFVLCASVLAGCKKKDNDVAKTYTLNDTIGASPTNWNPHTWETDADSVISSYAEMALVDVSIADDGVNFVWVYEMADSVTDVTAEYAADETKKSKWGIGNATENKVYRIALNEGAKWADGTAINADTYVYSMKQLLNPKMRNYRANTYYNGSSAIFNAEKYFAAEAPIYDAVVPPYGEDDTPDYSLDISDKKVYIDLNTAGMTISSYSFAVIKNDYGYIRNETDAEGNVTVPGATYFEELAKLENPYGYIEVTAENKAKVLTIMDQYLSAFALSIYEADGETVNEELYKEFLFYNTGEFAASYDWENVGLIKVDDYTIDYVLADTETMFYFLTSLTSNWIVYENLYESNKEQVGELTSSKYGTSLDAYMSYGPYKLVSFEKDKQFKFERNTNWYGWTDGKHEGQYQTTNIVIDVISDESTLEGLFLSGKIDALGLNSAQLAAYRTSEYLLKTDQTYTFRYIFATDLDKLKALETQRADGNNLQVLYYDNFRKALSLSINRAQFTAQATGGYKPAFALYNNLYYYDVENNTDSIYRKTDIAKQMVVDLYGIEYGADLEYKTLDEAYNAVSGYDVEEAKTLFQSVYTAAKADGRYTDGQDIVIKCMAGAYSTLTEDDTAQERLLNQYVAAATVGTGFEGKISFVFQCGADKRYEDVAAGRQEMIRGAWGGAAFYPFSTVRCYTEPDYMGGLSAIHESCGWNPTVETTDITYDFDKDGTAETVTKTLQNWAKAINGGDAETDVDAITDSEAKMAILAALERAVLESYQCIPFASETACTLFSQKIEYATLDYNIMYAYGGIRLMTYNYDDAAWAEYVKGQNNALKY